MTSRWFDGDDQLLEELGLALAQEGPSPEEVDMMMVGYDIVMTDTLEAALIHDSEADATVAVRSTTAGTRMMAFALDDMEIEFELGDGRIAGHVDPPQGGQVRLEQPTATSAAVTEVTPDELGGFEVPLRLPATFRLRFIDENGRSVATTWIVGPHETTA